MRAFGFFVITLLLAAAAAAGAGDNVTWAKSGEIPYVGLDNDGSAAPTAYDEEVARYSVAWLPPAGKKEIDFIEAMYYGWGLHCARLKAAVADGKHSESAFFYEIERSKDVFRSFIIFYITISAGEQPDTDLADARRWTIYLERGEEKYTPVLINEDENAPRGAIIRYEVDPEVIAAYGGAFDLTAEELNSVKGRGFADRFWYRKTYKIAFANPYGEPPRENLRLVISGDKAQRGFEWRFKEE